MSEGQEGTEIGVTTVTGVDTTPDSQVLAMLRLNAATSTEAQVFGETELVAIRGPDGHSMAVAGNECNPTATIRKGRATRSLRQAYGGDVKANVTIHWDLAQEGAIPAKAAISTLKLRKVVGDQYHHFLPIVSMIASISSRLGLNEKFDTSFFGRSDDASRALSLAIHTALNDGHTLWGVDHAAAYTRCFSVPERNADDEGMVIDHCDIEDWDATRVNLSALFRGLAVPLKSQKQGVFGKGNFN